MNMYHKIDELRAIGHFFAAGALAAELGHERYYGCHVGMRSTLERDREAFFAGWDAAKAYKGRWSDRA